MDMEQSFLSSINFDPNKSITHSLRHTPDKDINSPNKSKIDTID